MAAKPAIELTEDTFGFCMMEVIYPATQFGREFVYRFTDIPTSGHAKQCFDVACKAFHTLISHFQPDVVLPAAYRIAKEAALPWPIGSTLVSIDLKLQALFKELRGRTKHSVRCAFTAHIDVAIIRVAAEA